MQALAPERLTHSEEWSVYPKYMDHKAAYTVNKGILPEALVHEMCESFKRCEDFLDLEIKEEDPLLKQKKLTHSNIVKAIHEQLGKMQEMLE